MILYKLIDAESWRAAVARGRFDGAAIDLQDGYIHFSTAAQAAETARRYFHGVADLLIVSVPADSLPPETAQALRWEPARNGDLFPHLYAPLDPALATQARPVALAADGTPMLGELAP